MSVCFYELVIIGGGGRLVLSGEERDEIRDAEFDSEPRKGRKKKKFQGSASGYRDEDDDLGSLFGTGITGKMPKFANKITFKVLFLIIYDTPLSNFCHDTFEKYG